MGNGRGTRDQLRASGASKGAPYGRTLPLERDGRRAREMRASGVGAGAVSRRMLRPDVRALALPFVLSHII